MGGAMKYFLKKLLGHEIFVSMVFWATNFFFEKFVKPSGPSPSYVLNVCSLNKFFFKHNISSGDFKYFNRRTIAGKVLRDKAFHIAKKQNMMNINLDLLKWFINFLTKKSSGETLKNETITCKELAGELHKPIIKKFEKGKGNSL